MSQPSSAPAGTPFEEASSVLRAAQQPPALVILEADVLWPSTNAAIASSSGQPPHEHAVAVANVLHARGIKVAVVSACDGIQPLLQRHFSFPIAVERCDASDPTSWQEAARRLKGTTGTPMTHTLLIAASPAALRSGSALGMTAVRAPQGLPPSVLRAALETFAHKSLDDRGF